MKTLAGIGNVSDIGHSPVVYFLIACAASTASVTVVVPLSLRIQYLHEFFEMFLGYKGQYLILGRRFRSKSVIPGCFLQWVAKEHGNIEISECILTICRIFWSYSNLCSLWPATRYLIFQDMADADEDRRIDCKAIKRNSGCVKMQQFLDCFQVVLSSFWVQNCSTPLGWGVGNSILVPVTSDFFDLQKLQEFAEFIASGKAEKVGIKVPW